VHCLPCAVLLTIVLGQIFSINIPTNTLFPRVFKTAI
jgi:hypothetical protein